MKVVAVASGGGHWIELVQLQPAFQEHELIYMSTREGFASQVEGYEFHTIPDFSRTDAWKIPSAIWKTYKILKKVKPDVVISTGAAPGVIGCLVGKLLGAKVIWVEALCYAEEISISGKMVSLFADKVYTQWEDYSNSKFVYAGNILL